MDNLLWITELSPDNLRASPVWDSFRSSGQQWVSNGQHGSQNGTISPESVLGLPAPDNLRPSYLLGKLG